MNKNDFKNPLIQSGAVLLFVFLLISIVASSGSQGVWGSIGALFSGLISGFIFLLALCFAIIFSIFVIVVLFIAAVSIYSVDKGKEMWGSFINSLGALFHNITASNKTISRISAAAADASGKSGQVLSDGDAKQLASLDVKLGDFDAKLNELVKTSAIQADAIDQLKQQIADIANSDSFDEKFADMTISHQALESRLEEISSELNSGIDARQQFENQFTDEIGSIQEELKALHEKTSVPDMIAGVLSYIDSKEDRDLVTEKAQEAISRGMTYSQIDEFFKESLKPEIYEELASHPRLTKDFLRSIKKKF